MTDNTLSIPRCVLQSVAADMRRLGYEVLPGEVESILLGSIRKMRASMVRGGFAEVAGWTDAEVFAAMREAVMA